MQEFRLDRSAFKAQTAAGAADHSAYYKKLSWQERLRISAYLNNIAFNYPQNDPPRIDKTKFKTIVAGADGYILKKTPPAKLLEAITDVMEGGAPMTPTVARQVLLLFNNKHQHIEKKRF